jgi:hypothetical protein
MRMKENEKAEVRTSARELFRNWNYNIWTGTVFIGGRTPEEFSTADRRLFMIS